MEELKSIQGFYITRIGSGMTACGATGCWRAFTNTSKFSTNITIGAAPPGVTAIAVAVAAGGLFGGMVALLLLLLLIFPAEIAVSSSRRVFAW